MTDIVDELRAKAAEAPFPLYTYKLCGRAADEIERLRRENKSLRGRLKRWEPSLTTGHGSALENDQTIGA